MEKTQTCTGQSASWDASLKCAYTKACSVENKHEQVEICVQVNSYDVGIAEMRWDCSWDCSITMEESRL